MTEHELTQGFCGAAWTSLCLVGAFLLVIGGLYATYDLSTGLITQGVGILLALWGTRIEQNWYL